MDKNFRYTDGSITIRKYKNDDAEHLYRAVSESIPELSPWLHWCHKEFSFDDIKNWSTDYNEAWKTGKEYDFVIIKNTDDLPLGVCGFNQFNNENRFANLGYWVKTSHTKQGIAKAAALLIARFGFTELNLNRVEIVIAVENTPSHKVARGIGATKEGLLRKRLVARDKVYDAVMYSLLPEDIE
jgi:RimJ/RimL family protein N-acetyltransferase